MPDEPARAPAAAACRNPGETRPRGARWMTAPAAPGGSVGATVVPRCSSPRARGAALRYSARPDPCWDESGRGSTFPPRRTLPLARRCGESWRGINRSGGEPNAGASRVSRKAEYLDDRRSCEVRPPVVGPAAARAAVRVRIGPGAASRPTRPRPMITSIAGLVQRTAPRRGVKPPVAGRGVVVLIGVDPASDPVNGRSWRARIRAAGPACSPDPVRAKSGASRGASTVLVAKRAAVITTVWLRDPAR